MPTPSGSADPRTHKFLPVDFDMLFGSQAVEGEAFLYILTSAKLRITICVFFLHRSVALRLFEFSSSWSPSSLKIDICVSSCHAELSLSQDPQRSNSIPSERSDEVAEVTRMAVDFSTFRAKKDVRGLYTSRCELSASLLGSLKDPLTNIE
jgi:hypothetical protein